MENAIAEQDGFLGAEGMNNFYLYQYAGQNRFVLIPWDKDTTFVAPSWPILSRIETNVLARRLLADPANMAFYRDEVRRAASVAVNTAYLGPRIESMYGLIRTAALEDDKKPWTDEQFELGVEGLKGVVAGRPADIAAQSSRAIRILRK